MGKNRLKEPSEIIQDFLELMERSHTEYQASKSLVDKYDSKTFDWVHDLENTDLAKERSKLSTQWRTERIMRRHHKNNLVLYEKIHKFACEEINKPTLRRLKKLLNDQIQTEKYINAPNKEFKNRVGDSS